MRKNNSEKSKKAQLFQVLWKKPDENFKQLRYGDHLAKNVYKDHFFVPCVVRLSLSRCQRETKRFLSWSAVYTTREKEGSIYYKRKFFFIWCWHTEVKKYPSLLFWPLVEKRSCLYPFQSETDWVANSWTKYIREKRKKNRTHRFFCNFHKDHFWNIIQRSFPLLCSK